MKFFNKKNLLVGIVALALGVGIVTVFGAARGWQRSTENVSGKIAAFILNPEGKVEGVALDSGDQVRFGVETGAFVTQQAKIGDILTATGHAGKKSDYGREVRAETLQVNNQTITVVQAKRGPHGGPGHERKGPRGKKPGPPQERPEAKPDEAGANAMPPPPAPRETVTANGNVSFVLVGGRGEARGLILSDGTQTMLPREINDTNLIFNGQTAVSVEGEATKSDFGAFIRPTRLTIDGQTFSFNR